jgi:hypothetical protein
LYTGALRRTWTAIVGLVAALRLEQLRTKHGRNENAVQKELRRTKEVPRTHPTVVRGLGQEAIRRAGRHLEKASGVASQDRARVGCVWLVVGTREARAREHDGSESPGHRSRWSVRGTREPPCAGSHADVCRQRGPECGGQAPTLGGACNRTRRRAAAPAQGEHTCQPGTHPLPPAPSLQVVDLNWRLTARVHPCGTSQ